MPSGHLQPATPIRMDAGNARVWRGEEALQLTPKAFALLRYLLGHPGRLVTQGELLTAVWEGLAVGDAALTVCLSEVRKALRDAPQAPHYIETVPRRGYRFIGPVAGPGLGSPAEQPGGVVSPTRVVGREAELRQLRAWLERARGGERQVVFVTGEAGIGKTTVVEAFLASLAGEPRLWRAWGQCLQQYGAGEAYLPVLAALGQLGREPGREPLLEVLSRYAPTWLLQLPAMASPAALEAAERRAPGATRERMLRELAEAVEALTSERVLVLDDLHWSDYATLTLLSWLARRREPARLLLLGTYRPVEVIAYGHPLRTVIQDLRLHGQCEELPLEGLNESAVGAYLATRWTGEQVPAELPGVIHRRTDGHPLFMVTLVDALVQGDAMAGGAGSSAAAVERVPESLREWIEQQLEGLSLEDQQVLEAASVAGVEFSVAAVAAGLEAAVGLAEERCMVLARRQQFLEASGTAAWPDETVVGRYRFHHALYQQVVYERLSVGRRIELHRRIGAREEAGYGTQANEHAAELAMHFVRGQDVPRAVLYLRQAAVTALRRFAYREALGHLTQGLELLHAGPDSPARARQELDYLLTLGPVLIATQGQAAAEVEATYARAHALCQQVGEPTQLLSVLRGLRQVAIGRAAVQRARELGEELLQLVQQLDEPALLVEGHWAVGSTLFYLGELTAALAHLERGIASHVPQPQRAPVDHYGPDPEFLAAVMPP